MSKNVFVTCHSVIHLNSSHPYAAKMLVDAQDFHRNVMSGFLGWVGDGAPDPRRQMGVLSAWSVNLQSRTLVLVVQSRVRPDWSSIPRDALRFPVDVSPVEERVEEGSEYNFRVVVSATVDRPRPGSSSENPMRSRRVPLRHPDDVREWFVRKSSQLGFSIPGDRVGVRPVPAVTTNAHKDLKITRHDIRGSLRVVDPEVFVRSLGDGVGRARAYSCGLLLVDPVSG